MRVCECVYVCVCMCMCVCVCVYLHQGWNDMVECLQEDMVCVP